MPGARDGSSQDEYQKQLERTAADLAIINSQDGQRIIDLIEEQLVKRMQALSKEDEQCKALLGLMGKMGSRQAAAQRAVKELAERHLAQAGRK